MSLSLFVFTGSNLSQKPKIKKIKEEVAEKVSDIFFGGSDGGGGGGGERKTKLQPIQYLVNTTPLIWLTLKLKQNQW